MTTAAGAQVVPHQPAPLPELRAADRYGTRYPAGRAPALASSTGRPGSEPRRHANLKSWNPGPRIEVDTYRS